MDENNKGAEHDKKNAKGDAKIGNALNVNHEPTLLETDQESTNIQQEHSYVCNDSPISHKPTQNEGENGVDLNEMLENNMPDLDTSYLDISKMEIVYDFPNISF
ncbi:uncharacterized protein LOC124370468 [Homalodisca vitripennis]|uniref:uncharacterized protein LOC124370468 n=1 Tax=Homalodisca vitripennis TaxID=197043 RepID=UPI001EEC50FD|nr:uncharacterized protein LOC124370468 [Homalodisca vitripennis]